MEERQEGEERRFSCTSCLSVGGSAHLKPHPSPPHFTAATADWWPAAAIDYIVGQCCGLIRVQVEICDYRVVGSGRPRLHPDGWRWRRSPGIFDLFLTLCWNTSGQLVNILWPHKLSWLLFSPTDAAVEVCLYVSLFVYNVNTSTFSLYSSGFFQSSVLCCSISFPANFLFDSKHLCTGICTL